MCLNGKDKLSKILNNLRNYSFFDKMLICQIYSKELMEFDHLAILENIGKNALPWELETFAELSILSEEKHPFKKFSPENNKDFVDTINYIRNYTHPYLNSLIGTQAFIDAYFMVNAMLQFKAQENIINRLYRYNYFWNYQDNEIDMISEFKNKYSGLTFDHFIELAHLIYFFSHKDFYQQSPIIYKQVYAYITQTHKAAINLLKITRKDYIVNQQSKNKGNLQNSIYGFNYLFPYPFIEYEDIIYLPLPYLIVDSVTESLLTRATNDDTHLREIIGKNVAQSYIENILKESNVYDEVVPEIAYSVGKNRIDSPDVMLKKDNLFCLIDSKLSTPKISLRQFVEEDESSIIKQYAKNIKQLYKRIQEFLNGYYYPFKDINTIDRKNVFGVVVLFENSFVSKEKVYREVCNQLNINYESCEGEYIRSNIKITELHDIERFAFSSFDFFRSLTINRDDSNKWNDISLYNDQHFKDDDIRLIPSLVSFQDKIQGMLLKAVTDLKKLGIVR